MNCAIVDVKAKSALTLSAERHCRPGVRELGNCARPRLSVTARRGWPKRAVNQRARLRGASALHAGAEGGRDPAAMRGQEAGAGDVRRSPRPAVFYERERDLLEPSPAVFAGKRSRVGRNWKRSCRAGCESGARTRSSVRCQGNASVGQATADYFDRRSRAGIATWAFRTQRDDVVAVRPALRRAGCSQRRVGSTAPRERARRRARASGTPVICARN
jgi:hypothetical protein